MNHYIKNIYIHNLYHLHDFDIPIADEQAPHLMITGKNGSGKTVLLNALSDFLDSLKQYTLDFSKGENDGINVTIPDSPLVVTLKEEFSQKDFIVAFYQAARMPQMIEPQTPTKPVYNINGTAKETATNQFLNFLSDLKIQEALARNAKQDEDADQIAQWFVEFEGLLKQIYQDDALQLKFNYKDYSFLICTEGKEFKFTQTSDGFAAILDIVADLIMKMQTSGSLTRAYKKKGIVLIDEVETHLHLELQKIIMPILTKVFPNIQFIITTHSPFVLSSLDNAVAFDLEHREIINDLTQYSYSALAEGYFGVSSESSYMQMQLDSLEHLLEKETLSLSEKAKAKQLMRDLDQVPESVSPNLVGSYLNIKNQYASVIKSILL